MPRRKKLPKIPDYTGIPSDESKLIVQKSNPLQTLSETEMTLVEFKLLDAYLSKIDSHDEEKRYVRFEKGELERILGVSRILKDDLTKRLKNLFQVVTIKDSHKRNGFTMIALFEKAEAFQDEDGLWQVDLACTPSAMEYVFNVEVMGYLPYMLKNIIELTSRYSYILYLYLERNRYRKSWTIGIKELKEMLHCTADTYSEYKRFNDLVLKKCHKELNEKTSLHFSYEPTDRKGRKYTKIRFTLETQADGLPVNFPPPEQLSLNDLEHYAPPISDRSEYDDDQLLEYYGSERLAILASGCDYEFTREQMEQISRVLVRINIPRDRETNDLTFGREFYLREKYAALNAEAEKKSRKGEKPIRDRFKYFLRMLEEDTFQPAAYTDTEE